VAADGRSASPVVAPRSTEEIMNRIQLGGRNLPWTTAAALGTVAIALFAVVAFVLHPEHRDKAAAAANLGLTATERQVLQAATTEALNLATFKRASFDADYAVGLSGATGNLRSDLDNAGRKSDLSKAMNTGKFDLAADVVNAAVEDFADGRYSVLIYRRDYKVADGGQRTLTARDRLALTMQREGTKWLATDLTSVGLI
jgi:cbb3-type cytochrome oxidase subunit 3